jgi:hypothetical protein
MQIISTPEGPAVTGWPKPIRGKMAVIFPDEINTLVCGQRGFCEPGCGCHLSRAVLPVSQVKGL